VARCGYLVKILSLPTCNAKTISSIIGKASNGVRIYVEYSHVLSYAGPGIVVEPREPSPEYVSRVARNNAAFRVDWRKCLELPKAEAEALPVNIDDICNEITSFLV